MEGLAARLSLHFIVEVWWYLLVVAGLSGATRALQRDSVRRLLSLRLLLLLSLGVGRRFHGFACMAGLYTADCVHHKEWIGGGLVNFRNLTSIVYSLVRVTRPSLPERQSRPLCRFTLWSRRSFRPAFCRVWSGPRRRQHPARIRDGVPGPCVRSRAHGGPAYCWVRG
jgi:hypothetical protein